MITEERLKELIKQEATIYVLNVYHICDKIYKIKLNDIYYRINNYGLVDDTNYSMSFNELFETKEEADFVSKHYDTRIETFEPPFELRDEQKYCFIDKEGNKCVICCSIGSPIGDIDVYTIFQCVSENKTYAGEFDTYQEAVDYAHKLFKGENDDKT